MLIEVIATSVDDAILADQNGADRIELISGIMEGGLTPSYGLIEEVLQAVSIPVQVMVRPHSRSFCYTEADLRVMKRDIQIIKELGATGIVIGTLTKNKRVDRNALEQLLAEASGLDVTFHRAFDEVTDQMEALQLLLGYQPIRRILTSGGQSKAPDAIEQILKLVECTKNAPLHILAGSGLHLHNITEFVAKTGVQEIHLGTGVRFHEQPLEMIDPQKLVALRELVG